MDQPDQSPQQRELVYCHQCENEWYRDEHGIICPECQSDFTEIIEPDHDPGDYDGPQGYAPDPDEEDIDQFQWQNNAPGEQPGGRFQGTFTRNIRLTAQDLQNGSGGIGGGLMGLLGPAIQNILGGQQHQQPQQGQGQIGSPHPEGEADRTAPGSPQQGQPGQQEGGNGGTFIRHGHGPGYSFTITTSSNANLQPRDANAPQPYNGQPDNLQRLMAQMMANIGVMPGQGFGGGGGMRGGAGPVFMGIGGGQGGVPGGGGFGGGRPIPINDLFQLLVPPGGVHGDAVYSQEALDRIITQLMEQHQSGNAPGPASSEAIESLPKRQITQKDVGDNGKVDCSICMDEAEIGSTVTELPCGHWFHHDCIKAWLGEHDTCPHCRQGIMPKDEPNTNRPRQPSQAPLHDMHSPDYQRPHAPGEYPFPQAGGSTRGDGSQDNPFTVIESPSEAQQAQQSTGGMFSRMREAFSTGGGDSSRGSGPNPTSEGGPAGDAGKAPRRNGQ